MRLLRSMLIGLALLLTVPVATAAASTAYFSNGMSDNYPYAGFTCYIAAYSGGAFLSEPGQACSVNGVMTDTTASVTYEYRTSGSGTEWYGFFYNDFLYHHVASATGSYAVAAGTGFSIPPSISMCMGQNANTSYVTCSVP